MKLDIATGVGGMTITPKVKESRATRDENSTNFVSLGLSRLAFEALVDGGQNDQARAVSRLESAIRCYLGDRDTGHPAWPYPAFLRGSEVQEDVKLELSLDRALWGSFEAEAARQGVSAQQLSEHAAFYLAAELDAGRITQRILDDLESTEKAENGAA